MPSENEYSGRCFCGAVEISVVGKPAAMGYCHCQSCRAWSAGPVNAFSLWAPDAVRIVRGADQIGAFSKIASSIRKWCKQCGGHLLTEHPGFGLTDVYTAVIPDLPSLPCFTSTMARRFSRCMTACPSRGIFRRRWGLGALGARVKAPTEPVAAR